jgi:hypothetical protein
MADETLHQDTQALAPVSHCRGAPPQHGAGSPPPAGAPRPLPGGRTPRRSCRVRRHGPWRADPPVRALPRTSRVDRRHLVAHRMWPQPRPHPRLAAPPHAPPPCGAPRVPAAAPPRPARSPRTPSAAVATFWRTRAAPRCLCARLAGACPAGARAATAQSRRGPLQAVRGPEARYPPGASASRQTHGRAAVPFEPLPPPPPSANPVFPSRASLPPPAVRRHPGPAAWLGRRPPPPTPLPGQLRGPGRAAATLHGRHLHPTRATGACAAPACPERMARHASAKTPNLPFSSPPAPHRLLCVLPAAARTQPTPPAACGCGRPSSEGGTAFGTALSTA